MLIIITIQQLINTANNFRHLIPKCKTLYILEKFVEKDSVQKFADLTSIIISFEKQKHVFN